MKNRAIVGLLLFGIFLAANYFGPLVWALFLLAIAWIAFFEFKGLCEKMATYPLSNWIIFFMALFYILPPLAGAFYPQEISPSFTFKIQLILLIASYVVIFPRVLLRNTLTKFEDITASLWAVVHLALLPSFFVWIRMFDRGFELILILVMAIALNDIAAMLLGKAFGRIQITPTISPNKTVFGSLAGIAVAAYFFAWALMTFDFEINTRFLATFSSIDFSIELHQYLLLFFLGALIAIWAQIGDLLMSVLKREAGVKDSGNLLQEHGGVLDRVDSHFFVAWFAYFALTYLIY